MHNPTITPIDPYDDHDDLRFDDVFIGPVSINGPLAEKSKQIIDEIINDASTQQKIDSVYLPNYGNYIEVNQQHPVNAEAPVNAEEHPVNAEENKQLDDLIREIENVDQQHIIENNEESEDWSDSEYLPYSNFSDSSSEDIPKSKSIFPSKIAPITKKRGRPPKREKESEISNSDTDRPIKKLKPRQKRLTKTKPKIIANDDPIKSVDPVVLSKWITGENLSKTLLQSDMGIVRIPKKVDLKMKEIKKGQIPINVFDDKVVEEAIIDTKDAISFEDAVSRTYSRFKPLLGEGRIRFCGKFGKITMQEHGKIKIIINGEEIYFTVIERIGNFSTFIKNMYAKSDSIGAFYEKCKSWSLHRKELKFDDAIDFKNIDSLWISPNINEMSATVVQKQLVSAKSISLTSKDEKKELKRLLPKKIKIQPTKIFNISPQTIKNAEIVNRTTLAQSSVWGKGKTPTKLFNFVNKEKLCSDDLLKLYDEFTQLNISHDDSPWIINADELKNTLTEILKDDVENIQSILMNNNYEPLDVLPPMKSKLLKFLRVLELSKQKSSNDIQLGLYQKKLNELSIKYLYFDGLFFPKSAFYSFVVNKKVNGIDQELLDYIYYHIVGAATKILEFIISCGDAEFSEDKIYNVMTSLFPNIYDDNVEYVKDVFDEPDEPGKTKQKFSRRYFSEQAKLNFPEAIVKISHGDLLDANIRVSDEYQSLSTRLNFILHKQFEDCCISPSEAYERGFIRIGPTKNKYEGEGEAHKLGGSRVAYIRKYETKKFKILFSEDDAIAAANKYRESKLFAPAIYYGPGRSNQPDKYYMVRRSILQNVQELDEINIKIFSGEEDPIFYIRRNEIICEIWITPNSQLFYQGFVNRNIPVSSVFSFASFHSTTPTGMVKKLMYIDANSTQLIRNLSLHLTINDLAIIRMFGILLNRTFNYITELCTTIEKINGRLVDKKIKYQPSLIKAALNKLFPDIRVLSDVIFDDSTDDEFEEEFSDSATDTEDDEYLDENDITEIISINNELMPSIEKPNISTITIEPAQLSAKTFNHMIISNNKNQNIDIINTKFDPNTSNTMLKRKFKEKNKPNKKRASSKKTTNTTLVKLNKNH